VVFFNGETSRQIAAKQGYALFDCLFDTSSFDLRDDLVFVPSPAHQAQRGKRGEGGRDLLSIPIQLYKYLLNGFFSTKIMIR
jgi:hypothetical protein